MRKEQGLAASSSIYEDMGNKCGRVHGNGPEESIRTAPYELQKSTEVQVRSRAKDGKVGLLNDVAGPLPFPFHPNKFKFSSSFHVSVADPWRVAPSGTRVLHVMRNIRSGGSDILN